MVPNEASISRTLHINISILRSCSASSSRVASISFTPYKKLIYFSKAFFILSSALAKLNCSPNNQKCCCTIFWMWSLSFAYWVISNTIVLSNSITLYLSWTNLIVSITFSSFVLRNISEKSCLCSGVSSTICSTIVRTFSRSLELSKRFKKPNKDFSWTGFNL